MYLSTRWAHWHPSSLTFCWCTRQVTSYSRINSSLTFCWCARSFTSLRPFNSFLPLHIIIRVKGNGNCTDRLVDPRSRQQGPLAQDPAAPYWQDQLFHAGKQYDRAPAELCVPVSASLMVCPQWLCKENCWVEMTSTREKPVIVWIVSPPRHICLTAITLGHYFLLTRTGYLAFLCSKDVWVIL